MNINVGKYIYFLPLGSIVKKLFNSEIAESKSNCFVTHLVYKLSIRNKAPMPNSFEAEV